MLLNREPDLSAVSKPFSVNFFFYEVARGGSLKRLCGTHLVKVGSTESQNLVGIAYTLDCPT